MSSLAPLPANPALIDQVHDRLLAAVLDGTLLPGARVAQDEIAAMLGVSRQPVSHALQMLKRRGLLTEHGRRGLAVVAVDARRIRDLYQVRAAIEGLAAGLAARRAASGELRPAERHEAEAVLAAGASSVRTGTTADCIRADVAFHAVLHRLSGNAAIVETIAERWPTSMRAMAIAVEEEGVRERVWGEHADILAAVLAGAPEADQLARAHADR